jgi:hypothetical protein
MPLHHHDGAVMWSLPTGVFTAFARKAPVRFRLWSIKPRQRFRRVFPVSAW